MTRRTITAARARRVPPREPSRPLPRATRRPPPPRPKRRRPAGAPRRPRRPAHVRGDRARADRRRAVADQRDLPAVPRGRRGQRRRHDPENSDAGRSAKMLAGQGVVDSARFFELNATIDGSRGKLRPGELHAAEGHEQRRRDRRADRGAEGARRRSRRSTLTLVEGPSRKENAPVVDKSEKVEGELREGERLRGHAQARSASSAPRRARRPPRASCSRPRTSCRWARPRSDLVKQQLDAFERELQRGRHEATRSARTSRATTC